jgi:3-hydroxyacyl-[acyl-carrier-protein] dehydratase
MTMNLPTTEIEKLLPQRKPFVFIDELISVSEEKIVAKSVFTEDEAYFPGHFPDFPIVPGTVLIEALIQAGEAGANAKASFPEESLFFLATLDQVKLRRQVRPNDVVHFEITNIHISSRMIKQKGAGYVDQDIVVEGEWMCVVGANN